MKIKLKVFPHRGRWADLKSSDKVAMNEVEIEARIEGNFAIHRDLQQPRGWAITHLHTGLSVNGKIYNKMASARQFVVLLDGPEWNFSNPDRIPSKAKRKYNKCRK